MSFDLTPYQRRVYGSILPFDGRLPRFDADVSWVAPGAMVVGDVEIGADTSVWYGCVIRGDVEPIRIGRGTNIQDGTVIHGTGGAYATVIGNDVTIGHMCLVHGCTLEDTSVIGMKSTIMDGVVVEAGAMVAAGSLVPPGKRVKAGEIWAGNPAKLFRPMTPKVIEEFIEIRHHYNLLGRKHAASLEAQARQGRRVVA